jgi:large subunit ribosomal protein L21
VVLTGLASWYSHRLRFFRGAAALATSFFFEGVLRGDFNERADMYAVIKTGGKQYRVAAGEKIKIEQIAADVGQEITIDQVLAVGDGAGLVVGSPLVAGANVVATVVAQGKHDKVRIFKMRRRKHYQKRQGHRQTYTELEISAVNA